VEKSHSKSSKKMFPTFPTEQQIKATANCNIYKTFRLSAPPFCKESCNLVCYNAGICPNDCHDEDEIDDFCNEIYASVETIKHHQQCDICPLQCLADCKQFLNVCCPCRVASAITMNANEQSLSMYQTSSKFTFDETIKVAKNSVFWNGPNIYGGFEFRSASAVYWYVGQFQTAQKGLGIGWAIKGQISALFLFKKMTSYIF